jgi:hypothetical protein
MIVTNDGWQTPARALLDRAPGTTSIGVRLPPARIAFVPFSLDEVEAQPEDPDRLTDWRPSRAPCSCTGSAGILL